MVRCTHYCQLSPPRGNVWYTLCMHQRSRAACVVCTALNSHAARAMRIRSHVLPSHQSSREARLHGPITDPPGSHNGPTMDPPWTNGRPIMNPPPTHQETTIDSPWTHHGLTMDPPWTHHGPTMDSPWTHHGSTMETPWVHDKPTTERP